MSEAELHMLAGRGLQGGIRNKAARGELRARGWQSSSRRGKKEDGEVLLAPPTRRSAGAISR